MGPPQVTPSRVGRYEILTKIASGGMGTVYLARMTGPGGFVKECALKLTHPHLREQADLTEGLLSEARLMARIKHANVVEVFDVGDDEQGVFLAMEYVEGASLSALVALEKERGGEVPRPIAARILLDALAGIHAAHELCDDAGEPLGVIHRDVSPHNLLVGVDGITRVTDFGVAKTRDRLLQTSSGLVKGKLAYMAPEQARANPIDRRVDVWAAGVVAWEVFVGRRLFAADNEVELALRLVTEVPRRMSEAGADVPPELDDAVAAALEPDVDARVPTARDLAARLRAAVGAVADADEVAAYVREHVADTLAERRRAIGARRPQPSQPTAAPEPGSSVATETRTASVVSAEPPKSRAAWAAPIGIGASVIVLGLALGAPSLLRREATPPSPASTAPAEKDSRRTPVEPPRSAAPPPAEPPEAPAALSGPPAASAPAAPSPRPARGLPVAPAPPRSAAPSPKASSDSLFVSPYRAP